MGRRVIGAGAFGVVFLVVCIAPSAVQSGEICQPEIARFVSVQGVVEVLRATEADWEAAILDVGICPGDQVRVGAMSRVAMAFLDSDTVLNLDQNTTIEISEPPEAGFSILRMFRGVVHFFSRKPRALEVESPFVNAAVEGTEFLVRVDEKETLVSVFEGQVSATNEFGTLKLASNQAAVARAGQAPESVIVVRPRDAVQWTLNYPRLFAELRPGLPASLVAASESLAVGRVDEARTALDAVPDTPLAVGIKYAFLAVIAVAQNDKEGALTAARRAVDAAPQSSAAKIALSYALQASFELEAARDTLREAVENEPDDALAWARLAELWLSLGYLDEALEAAEEAQLLSPDLARTNTVLGFANLAQFNLAGAKAAFGAAIEKDDRAPLPRLGLGLAKIRGGDLEEGRRDIEIAALLDPHNSLIRSYLGKAYFEEKRGPLDAAQFEIAKELDSLDPTPWFYDAIRKQTENRPVEALQDLQKSIELNDNRIVYRSRLLLDEDRAARQTSLARIYDDLGFDQLGVLEATKSLGLDPSNHSAHRFLSDTYAGLPRHEIARASELLQSQLLQPININPVQPSLQVFDLNVVQGSGPTTIGLNEFNPLFERNQAQLKATGFVGNNNTIGDEIIVSALWNKLSLSAGQFHSRTDGFRENNDVENNLYNIFAQWAITPDLSLQGEYRSRDTDQGDLTLNFDPENFSTNIRQKILQDTVRVGVRHDNRRLGDTIISAIYTEFSDETRERLDIPGFPPFIPAISTDIIQDDKQKGYQVEGQHIVTAEQYTLTAGGGWYDLDQDVIGGTSVFGFFTGPRKIKHVNGYVYGGVQYPESINWTVGFSFDDYERPPFEKKIFNPKFGLTWQIDPKLTFRLAVVRTLARARSLNQTIEPTQVAGFNQFFDDFPGTEAWQYAAALDTKLTSDLNIGVQYVRRDLTGPVFLIGPSGIDVKKSEQDEQLGKAYAYWTPSRRWALRAGVEYERFEQKPGPDSPVLEREVEMWLAPLAAAYFHPIGVFAELRSTFVRQEVESESMPRERDSFVVVDAAVGYRFPKRRGILSFEVSNLFDSSFKYQDINFRTLETINPRFVPDRMFMGRLTLNF